MERIVRFHKRAFLKGLVTVFVIGAFFYIANPFKNELVRLWLPITNRVPFVDASSNINDPRTVLLSLVLSVLFITLIGILFELRRKLLHWIVGKIPFAIHLKIPGTSTIIMNEKKLKTLTPVLVPQFFGRPEFAFIVREITMELDIRDEWGEKVLRTEELNWVVIFVPTSWPTIFFGKTNLIAESEMVKLKNSHSEIFWFMMRLGQAGLDRVYAETFRGQPSWLSHDGLSVLLRSYSRKQT